jgi:hypothetical protein
MGSGDARLEALRFAWPGLRYENMFEGAMWMWTTGRAAATRCFCELAAEDCYQQTLAEGRFKLPLGEAMHQKTPSQGYAV